ncbi:MAG TPA: hydroxymethylbilane synthase [Pseudomonadales bacterium]|jgi:hydroxymethylbilane synthase|nr:hydroxymethylbilane synthase [Pseudomonadales bacterium]
MASRLLRIATRKSPLALWQANDVRARLLALHPGLRVELVTFTTRGDKLLDAPLAKIGGKGLFVKELEQAIFDGEADLAVHSMKDVPMELPAGLTIATLCAREEPADALVTPLPCTLLDLPQGARIGTSSLRRQAQLRALRPDFELLTLRGNVNTRLARLDEGQFDAIILAAAGLRRLGFAARIRESLDDRLLLPAAGQGAVGIECRQDDVALHALLEPLADLSTTLCVTAERAMNRRLDGGCQVPIAGHAQLSPRGLWLRGLVGDVERGTLLRAEQWGDPAQAEAIGIAVAEQLLRAGAGPLIEAARVDAAAD